MSPNQPTNSRRAAGAPERRIGLARALSKLGYCSRTQAAELIRNGRVTLNGTVRRDPESPVRLSADRIQVQGEMIATAAKIYLMLNKPRGVVTTRSDEQGRQTVYDLFPPGLPWIGPVGRLDKASEGLLLLTNDSEWAARITDPQAHLEKCYHVQIGTVAGEALFTRLRQGIASGGEVLNATRVSLLRAGERNSWIEIVLDEGRNRQIRRMLESLDVEVLRLGELGKGKVRSLTSAEKRHLDALLAR